MKGIYKIELKVPGGSKFFELDYTGAEPVWGPIEDEAPAAAAEAPAPMPEGAPAAAAEAPAPMPEGAPAGGPGPMPEGAPPAPAGGGDQEGDPHEIKDFLCDGEKITFAANAGPNAVLWTIFRDGSGKADLGEKGVLELGIERR